MSEKRIVHPLDEAERRPGPGPRRPITYRIDPVLGCHICTSHPPQLIIKGVAQQPRVFRGNPPKQTTVTRYLWERTHGKIPEGHVVVHYLCGNPQCINVDHMMLMTRGQALRMRKSLGVSGISKKRTQEHIRVVTKAILIS